jgi:hypothetical protein
MLIQEDFINKRADEYMQCVVKPFPTFEQYLNYCLKIDDNIKNNKMRRNKK